MGDLRWRKYFNTTIPIEQIEKIRALSKRTKIPISRLAEEAWEDLLKKYEKK